MKKTHWLIAAIIALEIAICAPLLLASQNPLSSPTTGTVSGLQLTNNYNSALDSVNTCNSGSSAPSNQLSGIPSAGNCWYNTSTGVLQYYDGANWLPLGKIDTTNHIWMPIVGGNTPTNVTAAATTNICGSANAEPVGAYLSITGNTGITSFGSNCVVGQLKFLTFTGTPLITYNASSMILPGAANITAAAGDVAVGVYLGSGNWKVIFYGLQAGGVAGTVTLTGTDQAISGGAAAVASNQGTKSSGTFTPDCGVASYQFITNGGAFTLGLPSHDGSCDILVTNNASAGTITFNGSYAVSANTGDALTTTNTQKFIIHLESINSVATYFIKALQ